MSADTAMSFDRMRGMLNRAAEIRESEQQQVFDSLDEIHARLAALDALGTMRKRLSELPDRTEVSVLAERLDETVAKLDAHDAALAAVARAVEALPDKLAHPFAQLDGRLDGMAGRMEGISGRMDGLDDRLGGLHKRLDELDHRLDRHEMRLDAMPTSVGTPIREKIDGVERAVREQLDATARAMDESAEGVRNLLGDTGVGLHRRLEDLAGRPAIDPTEPLASITQRLEALAARVEALDEGMAGRARRPRRIAGGPAGAPGGGAGRPARRRHGDRARGAGPRRLRAAQRRPARRGHGDVRGDHPRPRHLGPAAPAPAPPDPAPHPRAAEGQVVERCVRRADRARGRRPRRLTR